MILIKNDNFTTYEQDIAPLINSFFPGERLYNKGDCDVNASLAECIYIDIDLICENIKRHEERFFDKSVVKKAVYEYLSGLTKKTLPWGTLTGIRPVRLAERYEAALINEGAMPEESVLKERLKRDFLISDEKLELLLDIYDREKKELSAIDYKNGFSIYIGIPFCPTRCVYCSFTSYPFHMWEHRADEYIEKLGLELEDIMCQADNKADESRGVSAGDKKASSYLYGKRLQTIYVGGGTPTVLSASQIDRLLCIIEKYADTEGLTELTYEAGRPDTITEEKLEVLRRHRVSRISINPQTMCQKTLDLIGRRHTVEEIREKFFLARKMGFDNINMDIIAGLPGEDLEDFKHTLCGIEGLDPDSLTVHTLAIKRASRLNTEGNAWGGMERKGLDYGGMEEVLKMTELGRAYAAEHGLFPYYIYRQKNMAGSLENIGYAKTGKTSLYNILMMEEKHTVVSCGAGASTKRIEPDGTAKRCENVKDISSYLERTAEMIDRKRRLLCI